MALAYATYGTYGSGMSTLIEFRKITDARDNLKAMYDSAEAHLPAIIRREDDAPVAMVNRDDLVHALRALCPLDPQVRFAADGSAGMWVDDLPVHAEGVDLDSVERAFIAALRDYADLWADDLRRYPNHERWWAVANLVLLSTDDELAEHLFGSAV